MSIRITNLRLSLDEPESALPGHLARALGLSPASLQHWRILRKSLDARDKSTLQFVYSAEVILPEDETTVLARLRRSARDNGSSKSGISTFSHAVSTGMRLES